MAGKIDYHGIHNVDVDEIPHFKDYPYLVIRNCRDEGVWYYGAYKTKEDAWEAAEDCRNGMVVPYDADDLGAQNVDSYAYNGENRYWVLLDCGKEGIWFYGAYNDYDLAQHVARHETTNGFFFKYE